MLCLQRVTFLVGHSGCLALQAVLANLLGEFSLAEQHLQVCIATLTATLPLTTIPGSYLDAYVDCMNDY